MLFSPTLPVGAAERTVWRVAADGDRRTDLDQLAVEAPLELRLRHGPLAARRSLSLAVTMRTPGQDEWLALGFLLTEGIIARREQVTDLQRLDEHVLRLDLSPELDFQPEVVERNFYASSSCGLCGKASLDRIEQLSCYYPAPGYPTVSSASLLALPRQLREDQSLFSLTGGIHAAALFDQHGELLMVCEDVGRHNAVDKLIGWALDRGLVPLRDQLLLVSGRAGFELVQKAAMAGLPLLAAIGAPSSLAVELAEQSGLTLVGFLKERSFNVYSHPSRIENCEFVSL